MNGPSVYEEAIGLMMRLSGPDAELDPGALTLASGIAASLGAALTVRAGVLRRNLEEPCMNCGGIVEAHIRPGKTIVYSCRKCNIPALPIMTMKRGGVVAE